MPVIGPVMWLVRDAEPRIVGGFESQGGRVTIVGPALRAWITVGVRTMTAIAQLHRVGFTAVRVTSA